MEFPKFDGTNPRLWRDNCEMFFEVYTVDQSLKTRFAALNFKGAAASWLQTVQRKGRIMDWDLLCEYVMAKFDGDQYQILLSQFEQLRQSGSVADYQMEFEQLAHGLLLYNNNYDDIYFVTRFVSGLKEDIRRVIVLHRPKNVDTASALALIQEEELNKSKNKFLGKDCYRTNFKGMTDKAKNIEGEATKQRPQKADFEDKLASLKDFRKRNGLCFKCGEKWGHNHKCHAQVSLHVIEELLDALQDTESELDCDETAEVEETVLVVGHSVLSEGTKRRTMRLYAMIGKLQVLILVDSGSVGSFISQHLANQLTLPTSECEPA